MERRAAAPVQAQAGHGFSGGGSIILSACRFYICSGGIGLAGRADTVAGGGKQVI